VWVEKHRKVYRIRELIGDRQVTLASGYATKTAAKDAMALLKAESLTGTGIVPRGGERLFGDFLTQWWGTAATRTRSCAAARASRAS
jgi:hypothetical protein